VCGDLKRLAWKILKYVVFFIFLVKKFTENRKTGDMWEVTLNKKHVIKNFSSTASIYYNDGKKIYFLN